MLSLDANDEHVQIHFGNYKEFYKWKVSLFLLPECCSKFLHNEFNFVLLLGNAVLMCRLFLFDLVEVSRTLFKPQQHFPKFSNLICYKVLFYWMYTRNTFVFEGSRLLYHLCKFSKQNKARAISPHSLLLFTVSDSQSQNSHQIKLNSGLPLTCVPLGCRVLFKECLGVRVQGVLKIKDF